jgi:Na+-driven multidrug efflux pump
LAGTAVRSFGPKLFTKSAEVNAAMSSIVFYLAAAIFPNTIMAGLEGVLISTRDVAFHWRTYLFSGAAMIAYQSVVRAQSLGLVNVWRGIVSFQWLRVTIFGIRVVRILSEKRKRCTS